MFPLNSPISKRNSHFNLWRKFRDEVIAPSRKLGLSPEEEAALQPYRRYVETVFREISLAGFGGTGVQGAGQKEAAGKAELARVFVDLDVQTPDFFPGLPEAAGGEEGNRGKPERLAALTLMAQESRLVLLGLPGSGKTTLLKYFALCLARAGFPEPDAEAIAALGRWPAEEVDLVPVFVELRRFADRYREAVPKRAEVRHVGDFLEEQWRADQLAACESALQSALDQGRAIVFFDGLDEVPDDDPLRRFVLSAITEFGRRYSSSRVVVTCRPRSYEDPAWKLSEFVEGRLRELTDERVDEFIGRFYEEVARRDAQLASKAEARAEQLRAAVRREELAELARNPFMLTIMAWLHRHEDLPQKRVLILNRLVEMLLFEWDQMMVRDDEHPEHRLGALLESQGLGKDALRRVLCRLAFESRKAARGTEESAEPSGSVRIARRDLELQLQKLPDPQRCSPETREKWALDVIQAIEHRTGLLVGEGDGSYVMPYKLQEFLAGEYLCDRDEIREVAAWLGLKVRRPRFEETLPHLIGGDGYWDETVKWASAIQAHVIGSLTEPRELAVELCAHEDNDLTGLRRAVIAAEILWEAGIGDVRTTRDGPEALDETRERLDGLMVAESIKVSDRAQAGVARALLGSLPKGVGLKEGDRPLPDIAWVEIPPESFTMGKGTEQEWECDWLDQPFEISRYPVTVAQFAAFVRAGGYEDETLWDPAGWSLIGKTFAGPEDYQSVFQTANHPRVGVSWYCAEAFCRWLSRETGDDIRLPTEIQWERVAAGSAGRELPWGSEPHLDRCNNWDTGPRHTTAVGLFPTGDTPSDAGHEPVSDLAGNVWEWCRTPYRQKYSDYERETYHDLKGQPDDARVLRGGSWSNNDPDFFRCVYRNINAPEYRYNSYGFRCVRECVSVREAAD